MNCSCQAGTGREQVSIVIASSLDLHEMIDVESGTIAGGLERFMRRRKLDGRLTPTSPKGHSH